ncbi:nucleotide exchange factor GrpE [Patulibacter sp. NPDC049589]|uniref:nucleotide exchange factor GrpE n=1 Tax=Patulibacter sp. NPDC049589 TaxID=3154731 RepID=UPI003422B48A
MTEEQRDHEPVPAPTGTGTGASTDRPIPADGGAAGTGRNTPDDGSTPGDVDGDALVDGPGAGDPAGPGAEASAEDAAANADQSSADEAAAEAALDAEPVVEEEPDWKDRYVRSVAELDNVRKRARRDAAAGEARGIAKLAKQLLPALDNLDRALAHVDQDAAQPEVPGHDAQLVEGLRIVHREIHAALSQAGIEAYDPTGEQFDPHAHEALTQQPAPEGTPPGTILAVYQAGYRRGDDVLRAAKVVVAG